MPTDKTVVATASESLVARVLEEYLAACRAGERPNRTEYVSRFPEIAEELAACLDSLDALEEVVHPWPELRPASPASTRGAGPSQPQPLGDFRIVREIGRGGMGIVYEAEQLSLRRRVALKVLPFAAMLDQRQKTRFHNEAAAAASLHHPHIVPVYGIGHDRGVHYYAMQFIEGQTLAEALQRLSPSPPARGPLAPRAEAPAEAPPSTPSLASSPGSVSSRPAPSPATTVDELDGQQPTDRDGGSSLGDPTTSAYFQRIAQIGIEVAEALDYAHQHGIVHRDIKPSNLMLDEQGRTWVMDFGLAVIETQPQLTMTGDLVGTLRYMSPEQTTSQRAVLDHRTDIYSLGITLYELIALRPAFPETHRAALLHQVTGEDPPSPRQLRREIPLELETIVLKAISKEASDRYPTAQALADDLKRFISGQPVHARPLSLQARAWRWVQRNPDRAGLAGLAGVALLFAALLSVWFVREHRLKDRAHAVELSAAARESQLQEQALAAEQENVRLHEYYAALGRIRERNLRRPMGWIWENLDEIREAAAKIPADDDRQELRSELARTLAGHDLRRVATLLDDFESYGLAWSPDGQRLAVGQNSDKDAHVRIELFSGEPLQHEKTLSFPTAEDTIAAHGTPEGIRSLLFSPDGKRLFAGTRLGMVKVFDVKSGECLQTWQASNDWVLGLVLLGDNKLVTAPESHRVALWNIHQQRQIQVIDTDRRLFDLSRVGNRLVAQAGDYLWHAEVAGSKLQAVLQFTNVDEGSHGEYVLAVPKSPQDGIVVSPDERGLITAGRTEMGAYSLSDGALVRKFQDPRLEGVHTAICDSVAIAASGRWLITSADKKLKLWDFVSGRPATELSLAGLGRVDGAFHPNRPLVAATGADEVFLYEVFADPSFDAVFPSTYPVYSLGFSRNGDRLVAGIMSDEGPMQTRFMRVLELRQPATNRQWQTVLSWSAGLHDYSPDIAISETGSVIAVANQSSMLVKRLRATEAPQAEIGGLIEASSPVLSPDGRRLWYICRSPPGTSPVVEIAQPHALVVLNADSLKEEFRWVNIESSLAQRVSHLRGLDVGRHKAIVCSIDQTLRVFDAETCELQRDISLAPALPESSALSADERWAIVGTKRGELLVVDLELGQVAESHPAHPEGVTSVAVADSGLLVSGSKAGDIHFWTFSAGRLQPLFELEAWTAPVKKLCLSGDGTLLAILLEGEGGVRLVKINQLRQRLGEFSLDWQ